MAPESAGQWRRKYECGGKRHSRCREEEHNVPNDVRVTNGCQNPALAEERRRDKVER
jgi:hypothetical protein